MNSQEIYYRHSRPEVAAMLPKTIRNVLEVGCGAGTFSTHLANASEHWGVEPVDTIARQAEPLLTRVLIGTYEEAEQQLPDGHFDLVVCNDVIEHMTDHDQFLEAIKKKLNAGGALVGSVPNVRYAPNLFRMLILKDWRYEESGTLDRTHFRFFTMKSLRRTFEAHGYHVEHMCGLNSLADVRETPLQFMRALVLKFMILMSFGHACDVEFQQIGFRVRLI
jgi:2-polyprenyl-3-methyl-5-hydroxy-6-metoxy-1,4-benzoquinol methylase